MKKTIYLLIEKSFEQPSMLMQSMGARIPERIVDKTTSLKKAQEWANKSGLNTYKTI